MDFMISQFCEEEAHHVFNTTNRKSADDDLCALLHTDKDISNTENCLPPEMELGNIEYKVKLVNPSSSRLQHLITQMKWRLREGQGEAIYEVGVEDGGQMSGLSDVEMEASLTTLRTMAGALGANMVILTEKDVTPRNSPLRRRVVEVLVRKVPESQQFIELRLAVLGGADVGKSTLCGVMTQGVLDDGNGKTRLNLFRFPHEVRSGKTSSVCLDVIGFDSRGKLVNYAQNSLEELVERSKKLVTLIDLAGDSKYLKTTIHGLSGYKPHFACLLVSAESGPTAATKEHLGLAAALNIPIFVIVTKWDLVGKDQLDRFPHEVRSGKTSSVCLDVIGFDSRGKLVNYAQNSLEELVERSKKLVTLIDLAGDSKYLKTTIHGLSGYKPHFACLLVSAESGPTAATKEHLGLAAALNIPIFVIVTKWDLVGKDQLDRVVKAVSSLLSRAGMTAGAKRVKRKRDAVKAASELCSVGTVPILCISSVTGAGLGLFRCFLNVLPPAGTTESRLQLVSQPPLFTIEEMFNVPHVGTVVGGMLTEGRLQEGDAVLLGPYKDGSFEKLFSFTLQAYIGSIRRSRQPVQAVLPGEAVSIALNRRSKGSLPLRRGMVLISASAKPSSCRRFVASLFLLSHSTRHLCTGFQATVYIGSVRQTAAIVDIDRPSLEQGKWATVMFELMCGPEYIRAGTPLIFRQGKTKGMGEVIEVIAD
ncbi:elongation factor Tu GTP binding domain protein [Ancylostoma caninum]|uniref:Elongation factor Tu GTP binding domain protein n=1 Tax=Ancylostoma caninum TaxID=29170 RepID=A0A368GAN9_ANCCA|nr:elongation factor Tu GTP binding domain protein [Ancylostoma caninum]